MAPRHAVVVCAILFLVVALDWEIDLDDLLVATTLSLLLIGWDLLARAIGLRLLNVQQVIKVGIEEYYVLTTAVLPRAV